EYQDPPNVRRATADKNLADMVKSGELAAAIGLPLADGLRTLIPDAANAEAEWAQKSGVRTVNHIVTVKTELVTQNPDLPAQLTDLFQRARGSNEAGLSPIGVEPNRKAFETLSRFAFEQHVTPRIFTTEELFPTG